MGKPARKAGLTSALAIAERNEREIAHTLIVSSLGQKDAVQTTNNLDLWLTARSRNSCYGAS